MEYMNLIYLGIIFILIVIILWLKKPLYTALGTAIIATAILFKINLYDLFVVLWKETISSENINVLLSFYLMTFLQMMLEKRSRLKYAQQSFNALIDNRRLNIAISSAIVGLLPSAAVMNICAQFVDVNAEEYINKKEKMFVACYYRHIPEMFLPTFSAILLALTINQVNAGKFVTAMIPMVLIACLVPYPFYMRKMPPEMKHDEAGISRKEELISLLKNLWSLIAIVLLIIICNISVCYASVIVIVLNFFVDHFKIKDLKELFVISVEPFVLANIYLIMLFKALMTHTGVIQQLPAFFAQFPIPVVFSFSIIFFIGTIICGSQAMVALVLPMAIATFPDGGIPLLVTLMAIAWAAMQISPTHVCSFVAAEYYGTTLGDLIRAALPVVLIDCIIAYFYGQLLTSIF